MIATHLRPLSRERQGILMVSVIVGQHVRMAAARILNPRLAIWVYIFAAMASLCLTLMAELSVAAEEVRVAPLPAQPLPQPPLQLPLDWIALMGHVKACPGAAQTEEDAQPLAPPAQAAPHTWPAPEMHAQELRGLELTRARWRERGAEKVISPAFLIRVSV